jgi:hypothetical protein
MPVKQPILQAPLARAGELGSGLTTYGGALWCCIGQQKNPIPGISLLLRPSDGLDRRPLLTMEVSGRHARTRAITPDAVSPGN